MMAILDRIAAGEVQAIICQDLDRLARPDEQADFATIKNVCVKADTKIYTQGGVYDLRNKNARLTSGLKMVVANYEADAIKERSYRAKVEKARLGDYNGGPAPLGYKICFELDTKGKRSSWIEIDEAERVVVERIFELYPLLGANATAKQLNQEGYRGKNGGLFESATVLKAIRNPIYTGFVIWGRREYSSIRYEMQELNFEPEAILKPELRIVPIEAWEYCQQLSQDRSVYSFNTPGRAGQHLLTGFLRCPKCGGTMNWGGSVRTGRRMYRCSAALRNGTCEGQAQGEVAILRTLIPFLSQIISSDIGLDKVLNNAVDQYGKSITESELERQLSTELHATNTQRDRLIENIAAGVLIGDEAKAAMVKIREKIARIERQLATIDERVKVKKEYLSAIQYLKGQDIEGTLTLMAEEKPAVFRRLLGLMLEPNGLEVRNYRKGNTWLSEIVDCQLHSELRAMYSGNNANVLVMSLRATSPEVAKEMLEAWFSEKVRPDEVATVEHLKDIEARHAQR